MAYVDSATRRLNIMLDVVKNGLVASSPTADVPPETFKIQLREHQQAALDYVKWFAQPQVQAQWWKLGGYSALKAVVEDPGFASSQPYAQTFLDSMAIVKDFWAEPAYADLLLPMQERVHNYVIAGEGTAKEALDGLVQDWTGVFEDEGKY